MAAVRRPAHTAAHGCDGSGGGVPVAPGAGSTRRNAMKRRDARGAPARSD